MQKSLNVQEQIKIERITPALALEYLGHNVQNRPVYPDVLTKYIRAIRENNWVFTGDSIKFDVNGILIDGQHRLKAIVATDKTLEMLVVRDLPIEAFSVCDTGKPRCGSDVLYRQYQNRGITKSMAYTLSAAAGMAEIYHTRKSMIYQGKKLNNRRLLYFVEKNPEIMLAVQQMDRLCRREVAQVPIAKGICAWILFEQSKHDCNKALEFWEVMLFGKSLQDHVIPGVIVLREKIIRDKQGVLLRGSHLRHERASMFLMHGVQIIKCWNLHIMGKPIKSIRSLFVSDDELKYIAFV